MVAINYAKDVRVGEQPVKAAALGSYFVWPTLPERLFFRGQSLVYDFARQWYEARLPDGTIDYTANVSDLGIVTRASAATYWGPEGSLLEAAVDEARVQHDPVTGKALGLLVEREATNRFVNSYFGNGSSSGWTRQGGTSSVVESDTAFGGYIAVLGGGGELYQGVGGALKPNTRFSARVRVAQGGPQTLKPAIRYGGTGPSHTFSIPGDGEWHFISVDLVGSGGNNNLLFGGAREGVLEIDWLQAVEGPRSSTFIPTIGSPVTRAADNAAIDLSDVFNPDEGTLRITAQVPEGEVVASLGDRHVISDSSEFKAYDLSYIFHSGNTVAQLGEGIFKKVEYFPAMQGETGLEYLNRTLYGNGEQGVFYVPKPQVFGQQVLWQDVEGTVPVMSDGDPVGLLLDLSGNGNHAAQTTSAARPVYPGLSYDGADDYLEPLFLVPESGDFFISCAVDTTGISGRFGAFSTGRLNGTTAIVLYVNDASNGNAMRLFVLGDSTVGPDIKNTGTRVITVTRVGDLFTAYLDGVVVMEVVSSGSFVSANRTIAGITYTSSPIFVKASVGALVSRAGAFSETEREAVENYIMGRG